MQYKVKWRADGAEPVQPESFSSIDQAKERARELLLRYGDEATIAVWNEDETWQIVASPGVAEWCNTQF